MNISKKTIVVAISMVALSASISLAQTASPTGTATDGVVGRGTGETGSANGREAGMTARSSSTNSAADSTGPRGSTPTGAATK
jgi:hypothetical protein